MCCAVACFHSLVSERESFLHASGWGKSQRRAQPLFLVTEFLCDRERSLPYSVKLWNHVVQSSPQTSFWGCRITMWPFRSSSSISSMANWCLPVRRKMRSRRCQSFNTQRYARHLRRGPTTASIIDICLAPIPIDAFDARHIRSMGSAPISAPPRDYSSCRMIAACSFGVSW
jgi:hypothetical protein